MSPSQKPTPTPQNHLIFDPWNSSSTGHQRAESSTGTAWRRTREEKLIRQFQSASGDCRESNKDEQKGEWVWSHPNPGASNDARQRDIRSMMRVGKRSRSRSRSRSSTDTSNVDLNKGSSERKLKISKPSRSTDTADELSLSSLSPEMKKRSSRIFHGITVYVDSTYHPDVSDHYLKQLLTTHGAAISLSPSRKVSHVIVGKPNSGPGKGMGGGLAASKLQKEISRGGWKGFKVVFVEWVLESINAGKRLSEARFTMDVMPKGQRSVLSFTRI
ncbi:hypothetical protein BDV28DRAFT_164252 [Aspergillus coremiiformis]|uniref:BRCT domain-containing protein n=1 Tax=Aspergillus coremiiformis TaxID=138285 RepID=A0A5N6YT60_9EURO|nr:hypothetical protein BDV28DRAFT_164252 [Aspergillus coremiiformis]